MHAFKITCWALIFSYELLAAASVNDDPCASAWATSMALSICEQTTVEAKKDDYDILRSTTCGTANVKY